MKYLLTTVAAAFGTLGFALIFRVPKNRLFFATLGGTLSCAVYLTMTAFCEYEFLQNLVAATVATAYAECFARLLKTPSSTLLSPAIIALVPGGSLYYSMSHAVSGDTDSFVSTLFLTLEMAGGIAAGIMIVSALVHTVNQKKQKRAAKRNGG